MNRSTDKQISTMHKHNKLKRWAGKWMNLSVDKRKCMKRASLKSVITKMRLISEKKKSTDLKDRMVKRKKILKCWK